MIPSKPMLLGQAPARSGDGRPFTGASGRRISRLLGFHTYSELAETFELRNLLSDTAPKTPGKGDVFDLSAAKAAGRRLVQEQTESRLIVACGKAVYRCVAGKSPQRWYELHSQLTRRGYLVVAYAFPHPSGINHYWNDEENRRAARLFLTGVIEGAFDRRANL